jgi:hypothetical protein
VTRISHRAPRATVVALAAAVVLALALAPVQRAGATVPPKNCGMLTVNGKRYQIKADQMRCSTAKSHSRRYLRSHSRPSGYRCSDFDGGTKLAFRCHRSVRVFFAIRR